MHSTTDSQSNHYTRNHYTSNHDEQEFSRETRNHNAQEFSPFTKKTKYHMSQNTINDKKRNSKRTPCIFPNEFAIQPWSFFCDSTRMVGHSIATVCIVITNSDCVWLPCHSRPLSVSSQNWKYLKHSLESSDSEFIWPSGSTRPAPPLPVGFGGVHGGSASGAFISTSSSSQGIAKHKHKI